MSLKYREERAGGGDDPPGAVRRVDEVGGRKDILAVSIEYSADPPMSYKLLINSYVSTMTKAAQGRDGTRRAAEDSAAPRNARIG